MTFRAWQDIERTIRATTDGDPVAVVDGLSTVFGRPVSLFAGDGSSIVLREGYIEIGSDEPLDDSVKRDPRHEQKR